MEEILKNLVTETVTNVVSDSVSNEVEEEILSPPTSPEEFILSVPVEPTMEDMAWGVTDVLLDTGAAEGIAAFFGAPIAIVIGIKMFKRWRKEIKAKQMMGKNA